MGAPWSKPGRCDNCGKPFDDHKLPTFVGGAKPLCPPPEPYYGKTK